MTRLNLGSNIYTIDGFDNLDPAFNGWRFQDGLPDYPDQSVEGITISCALSYLPEPDWPAAFTEFARVLEPGGVIRVQDDWSNNPDSAYYPTGYHDVLVLTTPELVTEHMQAAGLDPVTVTADTTTFRDRSLIQYLHRGEPFSFAVEGVKPQR